MNQRAVLATVISLLLPAAVFAQQGGAAKKTTAGKACMARINPTDTVPLGSAWPGPSASGPKRKTEPC